MSANGKATDDFGLAHECLLDMARTDPQLAALIPSASVTAAMQAPGLSFQEVIATIFPALPRSATVNWIGVSRRPPPLETTYAGGSALIRQVYLYGSSRTDNHDIGLQRLTDKLRNLPDSQKQHSALTILGNYARPHSTPRVRMCRRSTSGLFQMSERHASAGVIARGKITFRQTRLRGEQRENMVDNRSE